MFQLSSTLVFCTRPGLYIQSSLCACVYSPSGHSTSVHLTLCALKAGRPVHSCCWGMRPGREPQRNNNPHQRSSTGGTWLSTFILWVYESSLHPSITHRHGEGRENWAWFAKYKLTTNWSLTHVFLLFFFVLLTIFLSLLNSISWKQYTVEAHTSKLRHRDSHHNHSITFNHLSIHQILQVTLQHLNFRAITHTVPCKTFTSSKCS